MPVTSVGGSIIAQSCGEGIEKTSTVKEMGQVTSWSPKDPPTDGTHRQQRSTTTTTWVDGSITTNPTNSLAALEMEKQKQKGGNSSKSHRCTVNKRPKETACVSPILKYVSGRPPITRKSSFTACANSSEHCLAFSATNDPRYAAFKLLGKEGLVNQSFKKTPVVISQHQQATSNSSYIDDLLPQNDSVVGEPSAKVSSFPQQQQCSTSTVANAAAACRGNQKGTSYFNVNLTARVHTSLSIFRSHIGGRMHLGSTCDPVTETIILQRNSDQVEKWERISSPPVYFERVEADANICGGAESPYSFLRKAACLGLVKSVQDVISQFGFLRRQCTRCIRRTYAIRPAIPDNWWPVGLNGSVQNQGTCMNPDPLRHVTPGKDSLLDIMYLAKQVFMLSDKAISNVSSRKTSLLYEVSKLCKVWQEQRRHLPMPEHVPPEYAPVTVLIGPGERFLEVKLGVYYMLDRGTVIKFMTKPASLTDFVLENAIGYGLQGNVKGTIGVIGTCPEAFCMEMEFGGVALQIVVNGDLNCTLNNPRKKKSTHRGQQTLIQHYMAPCKMRGALYDVRMLQLTGHLPPQLQSICKHPIVDSFSAVGVVNVMRERLLDELPFVTAEIINIVTRLSQQGLVNPDIKGDNIVIDGATGQPKMIDFGLVLPVGGKDLARIPFSGQANVHSDYPQTAPEYLSGTVCQEAAMTYGLSYMINDMLNTLVMRTGDMGAVCMSVNIPLRAFMAKAYAEDYKVRPRAYLMAPLVGACFPFTDHIARLFYQPRHTLGN